MHKWVNKSFTTKRKWKTTVIELFKGRSLKLVYVIKVFKMLFFGCLNPCLAKYEFIFNPFTACNQQVNMRLPTQPGSGKPFGTVVALATLTGLTLKN